MRRPHPLLFVIAVLLGLLGLRSLYTLPDGSIMALHYGVWGDWGAHFTFISSYLHREWGWWLGDSPLAVGQPFRYPSLSHAITALFAEIGILLGINPVTALLDATRFLSTGLLFGLPLLYDRVVRDFIPDRTARLLGFFIFAFSGSFGLDLLNQPGSEQQFASHWPSQGNEYANPIIAGLLPQRAMLYGIVQALIAVLMRKRSPLFASVLLGLLPFMHVHTWIVVSAVVGMLVVLNPSGARKQILQLRVVLPFAVTSLAGLLYVFRGPALSHWNHFDFGWLIDPKHLFTSIFRNFTFLPVIVVIGIWKTQGLMRTLGITSALLLALCLTVNLQPFHWDNIKVIWLAVALSCTAASETIVGWLKHPKLSVKIRTLAILCYMTVPAVVDHYRAHSGVQRVRFFTPLEVASASAWIQSPHDPSGRLCGTIRHNHWLPTLTGQPVVRGYEGWLWTWGIDYKRLPDPMKKDRVACRYWIDDTSTADTEANQAHTLLAPEDLAASSP